MLFSLFSYWFLEREKSKGRDRNIHGLAASYTPSAGDQTQNPDMCPDLVSNQWPPGA